MAVLPPVATIGGRDKSLNYLPFEGACHYCHHFYINKEKGRYAMYGA